eukprot:3092386-Amphidinium_carterae.1
MSTRQALHNTILTCKTVTQRLTSSSRALPFTKMLSRRTNRSATMNLFAWYVLGGSWQVKRTGREICGTQVVVRKNTGLHEFLASMGLPCLSAYEYDIYGEANAFALAPLSGQNGCRYCMPRGLLMVNLRYGRVLQFLTRRGKK